MKVLAVQRGATGMELTGRVLCHDIRGSRNEIVFRKGHALRGEDLVPLAGARWSELHLIELGADDLGQREAGQRLAGLLASGGVQAAPAGHRHVLKAKHNGLLKIDAPALARLNAIPGIAIFTLLDGQVVSRDQVLVEAQITPLAIDRRTIDEAGRIAEQGSVVRLLPFVPRDVVILMRDDRHLRPLTDKLRWFGCRVVDVVELTREAASIREAMERCAASGATLYLVSGSNALDPLDPVFAALDELGATMQRIGLPVHPGTLLWIASWGAVSIVGLPTCGLGTQVTGFDLVLPKLLAEGAISDEEIAAMGHGGILTFARARTLEGEPVDEPVR
jgi:hypothetical protein